jgi:hypothetical protein
VFVVNAIFRGRRRGDRGGAVAREHH